MTTSTNPHGANVGDRVRLTFRSHITGDVTSWYDGTVTAADLHGVDLAEVTAWDDWAPEYGTRFTLAEVGVVWPRSGGVRIYR